MVVRRRSNKDGSLKDRKLEARWDLSLKTGTHVIEIYSKTDIKNNCAT